MKTILALAAVLVVILGGAYLLTAPDKPDPEAMAVAEALALHTRALQAAIDDKCGDARKKLSGWNRLRKAGTPDPDDTKQARKALRQVLKEGCRGHG